MIPVSHLIGDNGCGYLSGPLEVFWCLGLITGAGLCTTMRGMMRDRIRRNQYNNAALVYTLAKRYSVIAAVVILIVCAVVIMPVSSRMMSGGSSSLSFIFVGPAVFLSVFINLNIGYLNGTDNSKAAAIGETFYGVTMGLGMLAGAFFGHRYGINIAALLRNEEVSAMYGAIGAMIGICISELLTLIFLAAMTIIYQRTFRHMMRTEENRRSEYMSDISGRFIGGVLINGFQEFIIHAPVIVVLLLYRKLGNTAGMTDTGDAIGSFYSKFVVIIGILSVLSIARVQNSLKAVAAAASDSDNQLTGDRITRIFARVMYFAIPAVIFTTMMAPVIVQTFFTGRVTTVIQLMNFGTSLVILYGVMYTFVSVLIRLGYNREMLVISFVSLIVCSIISYFLMFKKDYAFTGAVTAAMLNYGLCIVACVIILFRNYHIRFHLLQTLLLPLVVSGVLGLLIRLISTPLYNAVGGVLTLVICIIPAWFAYNIACMLLRIVSASAMSRKLFGSVLVKIGQEMGVY